MFDKTKVKKDELAPDIFFSDNNAGIVEYMGIIYRPVYDRNKQLKYYMADLENLKIFIHRTYAVLVNSLHKYYKGDNAGDFTLPEVRDCISTISMLTGIDWGLAMPSFMEYGINLRGVESMRIIHSLDSYKDKQYFPLSRNGTMYGKECEFERYYTLKAYDKEFEAYKTAGITTGESVFRWEVAAEARHLKKVLGGATPTLNEILNPENDYLAMLRKDCLEKFNNSIRLSNGFDLCKLSLGEKKIISYMANPSMKEDIRINHPDQYKKDRQKYLKLVDSAEHHIGENISSLIEEKINYLVNPVPACSIVDKEGNILPLTDKLINKEYKKEDTPINQININNMKEEKVKERTLPGKISPDHARLFNELKQDPIWQKADPPGKLRFSLIKLLELDGKLIKNAAGQVPAG